MTEEKTYSQKDIEAEKANAQHFKQLYDEMASKFKGFDPTEFKTIKEERDALKVKSSVGSEEEIVKRINEAKAEVEARLTTAYNEEKTARESLANELKKERVTKNVLQKVAPHATPDGLRLLTPILESEGDWVDGKIVFKDENGKPRYSPKDATKLLSDDEYLEGLKTQYPSAFAATAKAGTKGSEMKINGTSPTEITSLGQLRGMPQAEQKAIFNKMALENPAGLTALLSNHKPN